MTVYDDTVVELQRANKRLHAKNIIAEADLRLAKRVIAAADKIKKALEEVQTENNKIFNELQETIRVIGKNYGNIK